METIQIVSQLVAGLGILNVWLLRSRKATDYRGGEARNMQEEFAVYGLPPWFMYLIGSLKVLLAVALIVGVWLSGVTRPAAIGLAILMAGALVMHVKVGDPLKKSVPALSVFVLSLVAAFA